MDEEAGIYREEVFTAIRALADVRVDVAAIRDYLEGNGDEEEEVEGGD